MYPSGYIYTQSWGMSWCTSAPAEGRPAQPEDGHPTGTQRTLTVVWPSLFSTQGHCGQLGRTQS
ncbi:hypothetical protein E2C01_087816 [Portunus trituberculatus]|uniref:Uncharacterized protein n=1 Tax=Portunus trituberculatus TaxID=210409 RepID=A0A5B7J4H8_PORTR|nr:hypothetical protein [Portunus trituberculatus]